MKTFLTLNYVSTCSRCRHVNYPMSTHLWWDAEVDGEFDPYTLSRQVKASCINCGYDGSQTLHVVKHRNMIFDLNKSPFVGQMQLLVKKKNGQREEAEFNCSRPDFTPYDQLNALTAIENYIQERVKFNENEIVYDDAVLDETVNFTNQIPYIEVFPQLIYNFTKNEVSLLLEELKTIVFQSMNELMLVTFNRQYDRTDGFRL